MAGVRTRATPRPIISEKNMIPRKSPSAADLTGFRGTISTIRSMALFSEDAAAAVAPVAGVAAGAAPGGALRCSRSRTSGEIPSPGRSTFTRVTPMKTAIAETTTV